MSEARLARLAAERQQRAQTLERQRAQERERRRACAVRIAKRVRVEEERFKRSLCARKCFHAGQQSASTRAPIRVHPRAPELLARPGAPQRAPWRAPARPPARMRPLRSSSLRGVRLVRAAPVPPRAAIEALATCAVLCADSEPSTTWGADTRALRRPTRGTRL